MTGRSAATQEVMIADEAAMEAFAEDYAAQLQTGDMVAIKGSLGAGKTVFCRGILRGLGFMGEVASPSFALVHEYYPPDTRLPVSHADLYRIEDVEEMDELGLLADNADRILLVEWAERWPKLVTLASCKISIEQPASGGRLLKII